MLKKNYKYEGKALRKLREFRGINRKEAGILLCISSKTIEKFENGRTNLLEDKINKVIFTYGFSRSEFESVLNGKSDEVQSKFATKVKIIENKTLRRSYKKVITKEVLALKELRNLKGYSQYKASFLCGYSKPTVGHIEQGRIELPKKRICHIVDSYGYTMDDFNHHLNSEKFVTEIQSECMQIIKSIDESKLGAVHNLLQNFK